MANYSSIEDVSEKKVPSSLRVLLLSAVLVSPNILIGLTVAFPAVAQPLQNMGLNMDQASWFESLSVFVSPLGSLLIGLTIDNYGRRAALLLGILPSTIGWFILTFYRDVRLLLLSQALTGFTYGAVGYPSQVYVGECVMIDRVRSRNYFATMTGIIVAVGILLIFVLAYFIPSYQILAAISGLIALTSFSLIYVFIPESPSWLHLRGQTAHAVQAQKRLGIYQPILKERTSPGAPPENPIRWSAIPTFLSKFKRKDVYKPFCIFSVTFLLTSLSGAITMTMYVKDIMNNSFLSVANATPGGNNHTQTSSDNKYSILCGGLILASNVLVSATMVLLGAKKINVIAHAGASVGLVLLGYTTINGGADMHSLAVCMVNFMFNFGPLNFTLAVLGDAFPIDAKGFAGGACIINAVSAAVANKYYPELFREYGGYLYYGYSILCVINAIFCNAYFPEVTNKTLDQINNAFRNPV